MKRTHRWKICCGNVWEWKILCWPCWTGSAVSLWKLKCPHKSEHKSTPKIRSVKAPFIISCFSEALDISTFQGTKKDDWRIVSVLSSFYGIVQQNEYNSLGNITRVHLGANLKIGCIFNSWVQMGANGCISESFVVFYPHAACVYS